MKIYITISIFFIVYSLKAQIKGHLNHESLNITTNARSAALGGSTISLNDNDLSQMFENPSTQDSTQIGQVYCNINPHFSNITVYTCAVNFNTPFGAFFSGVNFINYGTFERRDATGVLMGDFRASDYNISIGKAHRLGAFVLGAKIKLAHSFIDSYSTTGLFVDVGGIFSVKRNWNIGISFRNMGTILDYPVSTFTNTSSPFELKIGTTFKPKHMPFQFTITSVNLVKNNFSNNENENTVNNSVFINDFLKRINIATEMILSKNFQILLGYSHKRKQELRLAEKGGLTGFSYGIMIQIKKIKIRYSRGIFHLAGGSNFISLQTNINKSKSIL